MTGEVERDSRSFTSLVACIKVALDVHSHLLPLLIRGIFHFYDISGVRAKAENTCFEIFRIFRCRVYVRETLENI